MIYFIGWAVITAALFAFYILSGEAEDDNELEGLAGIVLWPMLLVAVPIVVVVGAPFALGYAVAWVVERARDRRQGASNE